jgi:hypothetical protein
MQKHRPRLSIEIPEDYYFKLQRFLTHGMRKRLYVRMTGNLIKLIEKYGEGVVACTLDDSLSLEDLMKLLLRPCEDQTERPAEARLDSDS